MLITMCGCAKADLGDVKMSTKKYNIADFTEITIGMTYDEVVEIMGMPTGTVGNGTVWDTYGLVDGSYIKLLFGSEARLKSMCIVDASGRVFKLESEKGGQFKFPNPESTTPKYNLADFAEVTIGMTYDEIEKIMGEPTGSVGFGIVWVTYDLVDDSYMKLFFGEEGLIWIRIVDISSREFMLQ